MVGENTFYMWTIVEAWDWLIHLPVLGFVLLVLLGFFVVLWVVLLMLRIDLLS